MRLLIIGGGGREHALVWKIAQSPRASKIYCAPGNAGIAQLAECVPLASDDLEGLLRFAREQQIDLTIVGPEDPLCAGIVDRFTAAGLRIFGPAASAAQLEGDKTYAKQLMRQAAIPTAEGRIFRDYQSAHDYIATRDHALVVKAAGLAKGKGVIICEEPAHALLALEEIMIKRIFGAAGEAVVVEEKLTGPEVSVQALVDGHHIYLLESSQDHKRVGDGDTGLNTGGMGAYSPTTLLSDALLQDISSQILVPMIDALIRQDIIYRGILYAGLMLTPAGPKVLEFNCRLGDPETQVLLPRMKNDLLDVLEATMAGRLDQITLEWDPRPAVCVVLSAAGYPGVYTKGQPISGLDSAADSPEVIVFHAGTAARGPQVVTQGGRVLGVTALGQTITEARTAAYSAIPRIHFEGMHYRHDIGHQALAATSKT
ncbi:MAG: Phosphoribosylamine--glycine ligase [Phycisphaerae bacterium]|nr:Phosphoribosylamine--glycine ligase [Phycisphaerae bacterium]